MAKKTSDMGEWVIGDAVKASKDRPAIGAKGVATVFRNSGKTLNGKTLDWGGWYNAYERAPEGVQSAMRSAALDILAKAGWKPGSKAVPKAID